LVVGLYQPLADGNGCLLLLITAFRCPTKLAFCSRFRRQRKMPVDQAEWQFSLASLGPMSAG
jgi:hypothetical protein